MRRLGRLRLGVDFRFDGLILSSGAHVTLKHEIDVMEEQLLEMMAEWSSL